MATTDSPSLTAPGLLRHGAAILRSNWSAFVGLSALTQAFLLLYCSVLTFAFIDPSPGETLREIWDSLGFTLKLALVAGPIVHFMLTARAIAATVHLASESHSGDEIGIRESWRRVRRKNLRVVWLLFTPMLLGPAAPLAGIIIPFVIGPGIPVATIHEATTVFRDTLSITIADPDHSDSEDRFVDIGMSHRGQLLVVSYTERKDRIRIMSARPPTRAERKSYEETN